MQRAPALSRLHSCAVPGTWAALLDPVLGLLGRLLIQGLAAHRRQRATHPAVLLLLVLVVLPGQLKLQLPPLLLLLLMSVAGGVFPASVCTAVVVVATQPVVPVAAQQRRTASRSSGKPSRLVGNPQQLLLVRQLQPAVPAGQCKHLRAWRETRPLTQAMMMAA